ncbi:hypothetical protein [Streptomyces pacificus]|nr:hypothetical protein [Streptomyces pacificus]
MAAARLLRGDLDGAHAALEPLWEVPQAQRTTGLLVRTARVRRALTMQRYQGAALANELGERIEDFTRLSAGHQLGTGSGPLAALEA